MKSLKRKRINYQIDRWLTSCANAFIESVVELLQGHVTFDEKGNRETVVQITQNRRKY